MSETLFEKLNSMSEEERNKYIKGIEENSKNIGFTDFLWIALILFLFAWDTPNEQKGSETDEQN